MSYSKVVAPSGPGAAPAPEMIRRDADGAFIPADPRNTDWQAYQAWLKAGHTPAEPAPPPAAKP